MDKLLIANDKELNKTALADIIINMPGGLIIMDVIGDLGFTPRYISEGFCKMLEMTHEQAYTLYGEDAMAGIHPEDFERVKKEIKEKYDAGIKKGESVYRLVNGLGAYIWVKNSFSLVMEHDKPVLYSVYTDVTHEIELQHEIESSSDTLQVIVDNIPGGVVKIVLQNDKIVPVFVSDSWCNMMGDTRENIMELYEKDAMAGVHPDDYDRVSQVFTTAMKTGQPINAVYRVCNSKNEYRWVNNRSSLVSDENGVINYYAVYTDVTEELEAKQKYEQESTFIGASENEKILSAILVNITRGVIEKWIKHTPLSKNHEEITDYTESYLAAASFVDESYLIGFQDKFQIDKLRKAAADEISEVSFEYISHVTDDNLYYYVTTVKLVKNPSSGEMMGLLSTKNITDEIIYKKVINSVVDNFYDYIVEINVKNDRYAMMSVKKNLQNIPPLTGVFSRINEEYAGRFEDKQSTEECIEKLSYAYIHKRLANEDTYSFNYRVRENDEIRTKKIQVFYIDEATERIGFTCVDVTDILNKEQQKNEALAHALTSSERASKAKTDFLSKMSHDIRTPMNAIIGMTELTKQELDDKLKVRENLDIIDSSAKLLLRMINDILDMAQIESGNMTLARETFNCQMECQDVVEIAKVMFESKNQEFEVVKDFSNRYFVGDAVRLKRVILNLLNNAGKFTPNEGKIRLIAREKATENPKIAMLEFVISDNGIGIPKEKIKTIFEPFTQLDSDAKFQGTGLGLPIVKNIVEVKGGTISVESEVDKGTTFTVSIPIAIAEKDDTPINEIADKQNLTDIDFSSLKVLLIEDHPINVLVAKRLLEKYGATVDTAENGAIGYEKFMQSKKDFYNIIFMDIQMPVMNGYESAKAIRSSKHIQAKTIPIIAMTANAYADDIKKSLDSGMNDHIAKPISIEIIAKAVDAAVKQK